MKYTVDGFIRVSMTVEADSEDEAMETAAENFDREKHLDENAEPEWETANPETIDDDEDEGDFRPRPSYTDDEDDDDE